MSLLGYISDEFKRTPIVYERLNNLFYEEILDWVSNFLESPLLKDPEIHSKHFIFIHPLLKLISLHLEISNC